MAGGLGLGLGYLVTAIAYSVYVEPPIIGQAAFAGTAVLRFALIGGWTRLLLGAIQGNRKHISSVILAGAIGFALASLAQTFATAYLSRIPQSPNVMANAIISGAQGAIGGMIGGATMGAANGETRWKRE